MAERTSPYTAQINGGIDGVSISAVPRGSLWQVAAWPETFGAVQSALAEACACAAPGPGLMALTRDGRRLIRIEPLKWWIMGGDGAGCPVEPTPDQGAWLDMGHDQAGVSISGPNAAEVLKRMVSIDLRADAFQDLSFASTQMHHMITKVLRHDRDGETAYEVLVMRSYADDLREIVEHHLHHLHHMG